MFGSLSTKRKEKKKKRRMGEENEKKKTKALRTDLGQVTCHNINQLKLLNSVLFPVEYHQPFYDEVLKHPELTRLGLDSTFKYFFSLFYFTPLSHPFSFLLSGPPTSQ